MLLKFPKDLIQRLRTCSTDERRAIAIGLAHIRNNETVSELIRMVEGEVRDYTPRTYRTWWQKKTIRYSYQDQLIGIASLGETGSPKALHYLENLFQSHSSEMTDTFEVVGQSDWDPYGPTCWSESIQVEVTDFPNAKGKLRDKLRYKIELESVSLGQTLMSTTRHRFDKKEIESHRKQILSREPYTIISNSIQSLRTTIKYLA